MVVVVVVAVDWVADLGWVLGHLLVLMRERGMGRAPVRLLRLAVAQKLMVVASMVRLVG